MTTADGADDVFEPFDFVESAQASAEFEGSNVCRAATLSSLLQEATDAMNALTTELLSLGFSEPIIERAGRGWREVDPLDGQTDLAVSADEDLNEIRIRRWIDLNEDTGPRRSVSFLAAMLGSPLERESAAAAAALWLGLGLQTRRQFLPSQPELFSMLERLAFELDGALYNNLWAPWPGWQQLDPSAIPDEPPAQAISWDPFQWQDVYRRLMFFAGSGIDVDSFVLTALVRGRLGTAIRSPDAITRSLALAGVQPVDAGDGTVPQQPIPPATSPISLTTSTIIHGTFAWKGNWWRPGGAFHQFIRSSYRPNLFNRGTKYSWSGALSAGQRSLAASDFVEWAAEVAPTGVQSVFAHSYGGDIACQAANSGRCYIDQLVLLSTPVTGHVESAARAGLRVLDIRLPFDPVLGLTAKAQRIRYNPNGSQVLLRWGLDHGATHEVQVWHDEDIAIRAGL